jgi:hemolysin III
MGGAEPTGGLPERLKPRLRGHIHQYAFFVSLVTGAALFFMADRWQEYVAVSVYAAAVSLLFGTSALYHRITWSPSARRFMRRLDHAMIFVLIAGTYTPIALLILPGAWGIAILSVAWGAAVGGIILHIAWVDAPRWLIIPIYLSTGWVALAALPPLLDHTGVGALILIAIGGACYTAGAIIYGLKRPDPVPHVFGYHEIFHALTVVAAAAHYIAIAGYALPAG